MKEKLEREIEISQMMSQRDLESRLVCKRKLTSWLLSTQEGVDDDTDMNTYTRLIIDTNTRKPYIHINHIYFGFLIVTKVDNTTKEV